jgi:enoyl-CoA hydratase/carnithine racemase
MSGDTILMDRRGPVGWLVFNRPDRGNALNAAMTDALPRAWRELDGDPRVRVIVVTGAGKAFQTGLDVLQLSREPAALRDMARRTRNADPRLTGWHLGVAKPIITAVNGVCAGGGLHFLADSDIAIASSSATFLDPHVSVGQVSAFESIGLARRASFGAVARLAFTGAHERTTAEDALRLGWISELTDPAELEPTAQALAERIAENDPQALQQTKRALWRAVETGLTAARREAWGENG